MNEVILDDRKNSKTYITDALVTCVAIAFCSTELGFTMAFTHMASATSVADDVRKENVLNQMLEYMLKTIPLVKIKMIVSTSTVQESHLISFILGWAGKKGIKYEVLTEGADSAVFNIDAKGNPLMISTSLRLKERGDKKWCGHGIIHDSSNPELASTYYEAPLYASFFKSSEKEEEELLPETALTA